MLVSVDTDKAWERLRASRSAPPGRADTGKRRRTYRAAIEQAGQMFRAAAAVDPATRPLQAFYGLSQAGRAIAAAAVDLKGDDWQLDGHGIRASGFDKSFPDIELRTDRNDSRSSFTRLSSILESPVWGKDPVRLEGVWDLLPTNLDHPLTDRVRGTPLYVDVMSVGDHDHLLLSVPVCDIPDRIVEQGERRALVDFVASYPALARHHSYVRTIADPNGPPAFHRYRHGGGELEFHWSMPHGHATAAERRAYLVSLTRPYAGSRYFLPVIAPMTEELHPLMAWWALLYALSMLARYEPAEWAGYINVDESQHAVPIEQLLDQAIAQLPVLIADAIEEVAPRRSV